MRGHSEASTGKRAICLADVTVAANQIGSERLSVEKIGGVDTVTRCRSRAARMRHEERHLLAHAPSHTGRARTFYKKACDLGDADSYKALQTLP